MSSNQQPLVILLQHFTTFRAQRYSNSWTFLNAPRLLVSMINTNWTERPECREVLQKNRKNILFVTTDDMLGPNRQGCLVLGHNQAIDSPQVIPELSDQRIETFFIGYDFVLAMNSANYMYSWGHNMWGQLGRDLSPKGIYVKPEKITYFDDKDIREISCGYFHSLALTSSGQVYGWGCNREGQIIHRDLKPDNILIARNVRNGRFIKLCDFGLATVHDKRIHYMIKHKHTADVGDTRYMAPEILQVLKDIQTRGQY
ncbi:unnamed protein product [Oppiella nova]|uniref:Protein kinase domain-containing protein n=1 Tax=Oppiella nova TaxID=334625 RepID=A0A7R9LSY0_9ACAR|nr:unnamed protein product [Oppiella nova]CAG2165919.1 unnamed protein product [Oppiella nova]